MSTWSAAERHRLLIFLICPLLLSVSADAEESVRKASPRRAFWASLLVPGWGQQMSGAGKSGLRFFAADVGLWASFFGLQRLSGVRREHYRTFAADHAGARPQGKNRRYFDDLGFYDSRLEHNQFARREEGAVAQLYADGGDSDWQWDDAESRRRYRVLRNDSEGARRQALFTTGLMVVNHLVSAIHAARAARKSESGLSAAGERPQNRFHRTKASVPSAVDLELVSLSDGLELLLRRQF